MTQTRNYKKKSDPIEVRILLGILKGIYWLIILPFGLLRPSKTATKPKPNVVSLDTSDISKRWGDIETTVGLGGASHFASAIVSADKLVDHVLKLKGFNGETMGERLKSAQNSLSPRVYNGLWNAHKLRNSLVHEVHSEVMSFQVKEALGQFKDALIELGGLK